VEHLGHLDRPPITKLIAYRRRNGNILVICNFSKPIGKSAFDQLMVSLLNINRNQLSRLIFTPILPRDLDILTANIELQLIYPLTDQPLDKCVICQREGPETRLFKHPTCMHNSCLQCLQEILIARRAFRCPACLIPLTPHLEHGSQHYKTFVVRPFPDGAVYYGIVADTSYIVTDPESPFAEQMYLVLYEDGDREDLSLADLLRSQVLAPDIPLEVQRRLLARLHRLNRR
jgi:hypothetical protein